MENYKHEVNKHSNIGNQKSNSQLRDAKKIILVHSW